MRLLLLPQSFNNHNIQNLFYIQYTLTQGILGFAWLPPPHKHTWHQPFLTFHYLTAFPVGPVEPAEGLEPEQEVVLQDVTLQNILVSKHQYWNSSFFLLKGAVSKKLTLCIEYYRISTGTSVKTFIFLCLILSNGIW